MKTPQPKTKVKPISQVKDAQLPTDQNKPEKKESKKSIDSKKGDKTKAIKKDVKPIQKSDQKSKAKAQTIKPQPVQASALKQKNAKEEEKKSTGIKGSKKANAKQVKVNQIKSTQIQDVKMADQNADQKPFFIDTTTPQLQQQIPVITSQTKVQRKKAPARSLKMKDESDDDEVVKPTNKRTTSRQAALANKKVEDVKVEEDYDMLESDFVEPSKKKKKANQISAPQNAKPQMPKMSAKKQKDIPEEYLKHVENAQDFDPEAISDECKNSGTNHLLNTKCCVHCTNKNVLRAAMTKNNELLIQCLNSSKQVSSMLITWAPESRWTPVEWVFYTDNMAGLDILLKFDTHNQNRVTPEPYLMNKFDTGTVSDKTYGNEVKKVCTARGNRAGNEAFLQESTVEEQTVLSYLRNQYFVERLVRMPNLKIEHIQKLRSIENMENFVINPLTQKLLINGKVEIAEQFLKLQVNYQNYQFSQLMHSALIAKDLEELPKNFNRKSVNKSSDVFNKITALHTAALNPNLEILKRLLNMVSGRANLKFQSDEFQNQCIHYAAACESSGPLELLIARNFNVNFANIEKNTPLFIAVQCNRPKNAQIIVQQDQDSIYYKNESGQYPIHVAARLGYNDCIRVLCKFDSKYVDAPGGPDKLTPLMYAASYGNYETVVYLVQTRQANVNLVDKFQRSALTYAVRNGHVKIAFFLLQNLAFYEYPDNSQNYPLHFACAYGWQECVDLLLKAGANVNCKNEWGFTPILVALLKNHKQIVEKLLRIEGVDINGTDDQGRTMLTYSFQSITEENFKYIKYLIKDKGANPHLTDINGRCSLFYAVELTLPVYQEEQFEIGQFSPQNFKEKVILQQQLHAKLIDFLIIDQFCSLGPDKNQVSILDIVIKNKNYHLLHFLTNQINLNERPDLLFNIDCYHFMNKKNVLSHILEETQIKDEYLNGVNYYGDTLLMHILKRYMAQRQNVIEIQVFLQNQRLKELASIYEMFGNFEKAQEKEKFYSEYKKIEDLEFVCAYILDNGQSQLSVVNQFKPEVINPAQKKLNELTLSGQSDQQLALQAATEIFRDIFTAKYKQFFKLLINKGADVNQYSFNVEFLANEIQIPEAQQLLNKGIQVSTEQCPMIPISKQINREIGEQVTECLAKYSSLLKDNTILSQVNHTQGIHKLLSQAKSPYLLKFFVENGLKVNQANHLGEKLLFMLVNEVGSDMETFVKMYEVMSTAKDFDKSATDEQGNSAFLLTFSQNKFEIAQYLLDQGFDPDFKNNKRETALIWAVKQNNFDKVEMLVEKGVNLNTQDDQGRTALHYAINNSTSALEANYDIENILIQNGADVNIQDKNGRTALHYAFVKIGRGNHDKSAMDPIESVSSLCSNKYANPKIQDKYGKTVLHYAAQRGATISTMYLEKKGVDLHHNDIFGNTPLATALLCGHTQYAIMLIKEGSDVNQLVHSETKQIYEEYKQKKRAEQMIDEVDSGYKSDDSYFKGQNGVYTSQIFQQSAPSYHGGLFGSNQGLFRNSNLFGNNQLGNQVVNNAPQQQIQQPQTMFKLAVNQGQLGLSYLILDNGFDLMQAMEDSLKNQKFQFVLTLLQKVSDNSQIQKKNEKGQNLFHIFAQNAALLNSVIINKVLHNIYKQFKRRDLDVSSIDNFGRIPLHYAAMSGAYSLVNLFIQEKDLDLNHKDNKGISPLIMSIKGQRINNVNNFEVFKALAKAVNDINQEYLDDMYKNIHVDNIHNTNDSFIIDTSSLVYKVTPFIHFIRQFEDLNPAFRKQQMAFFMLECHSSIYEKDCNGKNMLMILVKLNNKNIFEEVFATFQMYSKNKIIKDEVDQEGRNIIHQLVTASKEGIYDSVQLLNYLIEQGFSYSVVDKYGNRPVDYACQYRYSQVLQRFIKLGQTPNPSKRMEKVEQEDVDMIFTQSPIDVQQDAEAFLEENKDKLLTKEKAKQISVDPIFGEQANSLEVLLEDANDQGTAYNAYLIKIDMKKYGQNPYVFYKLQLNLDPIKNIYILLTRWGMIGEQGMCQKTPFNKLEEAIAEFKKVFKAKTCNEWEQRKDFQIPKAKGKYILYEQYQNDYTYTNLLKPFKWSECKRTELDQDVSHFMKIISNIAIYNEALKLQDLKQDQFNMTNIPKEKLDQALVLLNQLEDVCKGLIQNNSQGDLHIIEDLNKVMVLTTIKLYQLIPMLKDEQEAPKPIDNNTLTQFKNKIYDLGTLEKASKIFLGANYRKHEICPLDYIYRVLDIKVTKLAEGSVDYTLISKYMKNTGTSVFNSSMIDSIYSINRHEDENKFKEFNYQKDPNRLLLFYGTDLQNIMGILNCGFKVSPMGVPQSGFAFGKGVYFSNHLEKSFAQAKPANISQLHLDDEELEIMTDEKILKNKRFILVCEVAMGRLVKFEQHYRNYNNQYGYGWRGYYGQDYGNQQNYFAIGTQKQLRDIYLELLKPDQEIPIIDHQQMLDDYEDSDSENVGSNQQNSQNGLSQLQRNSISQVVYQDQIQELRQGQLTFGKQCDSTRTIRTHKMMQINAKERINRFDTFWVGGTQIPDPEFNVLTKDGCILPTGKLVQVTEKSQQQQLAQQYQQYDQNYFQIQGQQYSEFVVKNPDRIKIKYLVELREMTASEIQEKVRVQTQVLIQDE